MRRIRHGYKEDPPTPAGGRGSDVRLQQGDYRRHGRLLRGLQAQHGVLRERGREGYRRFRENGRLFAGELSGPIHHRRRETRRHREYVRDVRPLLLRPYQGGRRDRGALYGRGQRKAVLAVSGSVGHPAGADIEQGLA